MLSTDLLVLSDALRAITQHMDIHSRYLQKKIGITGTQLSVLLALADESPLPASKISQKIHLSAATLSGTMVRLEAGGLITRGKNADDRRQILIHLTDKGRSVLASDLSPLPEPLVAHFNNGLPDWEKSMITCALQKLAHLMQHPDHHTER